MNRGRFSIFGGDSVCLAEVNREFDERDQPSGINKNENDGGNIDKSTISASSVKKVRFLSDFIEAAAAVRSEEERANAISDLRVESFLGNSLRSPSFSAAVRATGPRTIMGVTAKIRATGPNPIMGIMPKRVIGPELLVAAMAKSERSEVGLVGPVKKRSSCHPPKGILRTGSCSSSVRNQLLTLSDQGISARNSDVAKAEHGEVGGVVSVRKISSSVPRSILRAGGGCSSVAVSSDQSAHGSNTAGRSGAAGGSDTVVGGGGRDKCVVLVPRYRKVLGSLLRDYVKYGGDSSSVSVSSDQSARGG
uniref:hypothetical protein n=1 Tax=Candidatus Ichthyocystis hellenicum TaxID=1561003 RepID=UPI001112993C